MKIPALIFICLIQLGSLNPANAQAGTGKRPNVLFICVDDLRPELRAYGKEYIQSPHLDKLASEGIIFTRHYAQVPTCGPSRFSMLTGMLPASRSHLTNDVIREVISGKPEKAKPETFIHHLKRNGYYTVGIGKISHYADGLLYAYNDPAGTERELPHSWDELLFDAGAWGTGWKAFFAYAHGESRQSMNSNVKPYQRGEVDDQGYPDGLTAQLAIRKLQEVKQQEQPFFLGVGFFNPHLPFTAPAKYWALYEEKDIPLSLCPGIPENVHRASLHYSNEFNRYKAGEEKASLDRQMSAVYARKIRHAYYASISYVDAQAGKVLNELERLGLAKNTIVVVWGDHGWHLGDQRVWGKHTLFERALKSTLMLRIPGLSGGRKIDKVVSGIDIYPTLMELCRVGMPHKTDGTSMVALIQGTNPGDWQEVSYGYFREGITMRTARYRLTRYFRKEEPFVELYDHKTDPYECKNRAAGKPGIVKKLMPLWEMGNTGLYV